MKPPFLSLFVAACLLTSFARADEPPILAKARAYLGSESALEGVKSVHLVGRVIAASKSGKSKSASVDIVFQKPWQESITVIYPDRMLHTVLDNYEAWQQEQAPVAANQREIDIHRASRLTLLNPAQIKVLRADTWENLSFYRGIEDTGGAVNDLGPVTVNGIACEKVTFVHSANNSYSRYFDLATGRLVYSETLAGAKIREEGEIMADGIRFPRSIVTTEKDTAGADATNTYIFDKVTVNEAFPPPFFAVPILEPVSSVNAPAPPRG